jgi:hypothetical protein
MKQNEHFGNVPVLPDPTKLVESNQDVSQANQNYATLLMFLKNNPTQVSGFLTDIRSKFFSDTCASKMFDAKMITAMPNGMVFK